MNEWQYCWASQGGHGPFATCLLNSLGHSINGGGCGRRSHNNRRTGQFPSLCPFDAITYAYFLWTLRDSAELTPHHNHNDTYPHLLLCFYFFFVARNSVMRMRLVFKWWKETISIRYIQMHWRCCMGEVLSFIFGTISVDALTLNAFQTEYKYITYN